MCALDEWTVDDLAALVRRARQLRRAVRRGARVACSTCSPGRYPSEEFAELRPRIVWDRVERHRCAAAPGAQRLAVTSGGTIPDRGLFGVFLPDGTRVGELDEEMVYESRAGRDLPARRLHVAHRGHHLRAGRRHARARASPARCRSGTATAPAGRSSWAGPSARSSATVRAVPRPRRSPGCRADARPRRPRPPPTSSHYLDEQAEATGAVPDDRTIVVERFRDEIGDWRVCVLSPVRRPGARAVGHGPAGPAGRAVGHGRRAACGATTASCCACPRPSTSCPLDELLIDPDEIDEIVVGHCRAPPCSPPASVSARPGPFPRLVCRSLLLDPSSRQRSA